MSTLKFPSLAACALLCAAAPALHASSITYAVTLAPTSGVQAGTGTITLAAPPPTTGTSTYSIANGQLQDLTFTIGDQTFFLSGDPAASVQFTDGQLTQINFIETVDHAPARYTLELSNGFQFYDTSFAHPLSAGTLTAAPALVLPGAPGDLPDHVADFTSDAAQSSSPTPEPGSLILLATAVLAGSFFLIRHRRALES